jgi:hypothetical protein
VFVGRRDPAVFWEWFKDGFWRGAGDAMYNTVRAGSCRNGIW